MPAHLIAERCRAAVGASAGVACALLILALSSPVAAAAPLTFARCSSHQETLPTHGLECGTLQVPLVPEAPGLGTLSLAVQRVPASAQQVGTIVVLAGGPGQAANPAFEEILAPLAKEAALRGYALVSFDQRGTGQSGDLQCPGLLREGLSDLTSCGETLGATRADYTSQDSVDDLDALRQALGGTPLSLFAVSYGGKVAGMYALEHPEGVARMVLDSPVPVAGADAIDSQRARALPRVLNDELCADRVCSSFSDDPEADLASVVARLGSHPVRVRILSSRGRRQTVTVTESDVFELVSYMDLSSDLAGLVPAAVADAVRGDWAPLARLTSGLSPSSPSSETVEESQDSELSVPLLASTLCIESPLPWAPESPVSSRAATIEAWIAQLPVGITAPFAPVTAAAQADAGFCRGWPPTPPAPSPPTGRSAAPTLILSGDEDLRTPYEEDVTVAAGYSDARILRIPDAGHSTVTTDRSGCAKRAMIAFLAAQTAPASCPGLSTGQTLTPPASSLADVHPGGSHSKLAGRGVEAVVQTLREVLGQPALSGGGLAGGSWKLQGDGLVLARLSDIPGVSMSGRLNLETLIGSFTVFGRAGGNVTLEGGALKGRLAGARVALHVAL